MGNIAGEESAYSFSMRSLEEHGSYSILLLSLHILSPVPSLFSPLHAITATNSHHRHSRAATALDSYSSSDLSIVQTRSRCIFWHRFLRGLNHVPVECALTKPLSCVQVYSISSSQHEISGYVLDFQIFIIASHESRILQTKGLFY